MISRSQISHDSTKIGTGPAVPVGGQHLRVEIPHRPVSLGPAGLHGDCAETDFIKAMTHELRTPLNVIIGLCEFLKRDRKTPLRPVQHDAVDRMERNARALLVTVTHLIDCMRSGEFH